MKKKRIFSLLLAAALLMSVLTPAVLAAPLGELEPSLEGDDGRLIAYAAALSVYSDAEIRTAFDGYAFEEEQEGEAWAYDRSLKTRLYAVILQDMDRDGGEELFILYYDDRAELHWQLWGYNGNAVPLGDAVIAQKKGHLELSFVRQSDGTVDLVSWFSFGSSGDMMDDFARWSLVGGKLVFSSDETQFSEYALRKQLQAEGIAEEDPTFAKRILDGYNGYAEEVRVLAEKYSGDGTDIFAYDLEGAKAWGERRVFPAATMLTSWSLGLLRGEGEGASVNALPVAGERGGMTLTPDAATAYARLLAELATETESWYNGWLRDTWQATQSDDSKDFESWKEKFREDNPPTVRACLVSTGEGAPLLWAAAGFGEIGENGRSGEFTMAFSRIYELTDNVPVLALALELYTREAQIRSDFWSDGAGLYQYHASDNARFYMSVPMEKGRLISDTRVPSASITLYQMEQPTAGEAQRAAAEAGVDCDVSTLFGSMWERGEPMSLEDTGSWTAYVVDGRFVDPKDSKAPHWSETENASGHGGDGMPDGEWRWFGEWAMAGSLAELLTTFSRLKRMPVYPWPTVELAEIRDGLAAAELRSVDTAYDLGSGLYYLLYRRGDDWYGVAVREERENGKPKWRKACDASEALTTVGLSNLVAGEMRQSNITIDFSEIKHTDSARRLSQCLDTALSNTRGIEPNALARAELTTFVETAVSAIAADSMRTVPNSFTADTGKLRELSEKAEGALETLRNTINSYGTDFNRGVTPLIRLLWPDVDKTVPFELRFTRDDAEALGGCSLRVLIGDGRTSIQLSGGDIRELSESLGELTVRFEPRYAGYNVTFAGVNGEALDEISRPVRIVLPSGGPGFSVKVEYKYGSDGWGGQYDGAEGTVAFDARWSGTYTAVDSTTALTDLQGFSEGTVRAAEFMVSRGYLTVSDGLFRPYDTVTRYDFTRALVGMFFALDRGLTTNFVDVPKSSEWYPYVASAVKIGVVNGLDELSYGGELSITVEQAMAIAARTLIAAKGYAAPEYPGPYLAVFVDGGAVSEWAQTHMAMAVRDGIVYAGGLLRPAEELTRARAAELLYELFLRLYEVPPVMLTLPAVSGRPVEVPKDTPPAVPAPAEAPQQTSVTALIAAAAIGAALLIGIAALAISIIRLRKK